MFSNNSQKILRPLKTILWLLPFLWGKNRQQRLGLIVSTLLILLTIVFNTCVPLIFKKIINLFSMPSHTYFIGMPLLFISYGIAWLLNQTVAQLSLAIILQSAQWGMQSLSLSIFQHLQALSMRFHTNRSTGEIMSVIDRAQTSFDSLFCGLTIVMIPLIVEILAVMIIFTFWYDIAYSGILLLTVISYLIINNVGMSFFDKSQEACNQIKTQASGVFVDTLLNIETIKYFHNQQHNLDKYKKLLQQQEKTNIRLLLVDSYIQFSQKITIGLGLSFLTWKSGTQVLAGTLNIGDFVLINSYLLQFVMPLNNFGYVARQVYKGLNNLSEVINLLSLVPEIQDMPTAIQLEASYAQVIFNDVSFEYNSHRSIINKISFCIPSGKTVAIVGPTGAGKSTITRLLSRCYDVTNGTILFNNYDIRTVTQQSLHKAIGVVAQETNLFNDTLYYNITYGKPTAIKEEVERVIDGAQLRNFINKLPEGYNTIVGERGLKLSGGEKQRIAIARVLLKNPSLYIFDEATSSLDTTTEREIQEHLKQISHHKTTLIIAHRLSTITHADEIIVLNDGTIVEQGTHTALLKKQGMYADLWCNQNRKNK